MSASRIIKCLLLALLPGIPSAAGAQEVVYIETSSSWRWRPGLSEASDPREAWRETGFDDSSWLSGRTGVGPPVSPGGSSGTVF